MYQKNSVTIVGGGLTGLALAHFLNKKSINVDLYEKDDCFGGIVRNDNLDGQEFLSGCHYLYPESDWIKPFKHLLTTFSLTYGSITEDDDVIFMPGATGPVFRELSQDVFNKSSFTEVDIYSLLGANQDFYTNWLSQIGINFGNASSLTLQSLQLQRFFAKSPSESELFTLKRRSSEIDKVLGVPRKVKIKAAIPSKGFDKLICSMNQNLKSVNLKSQKIIAAKNIIRAPNNDDSPIFWCANPQPLVSLLIANSKPVKATECRRFHFSTTTSTKLDMFYLQIFSLKTPIYRIFIYNHSRGSFVCTEVIGQPHHADIKKDTERLLRVAGIDQNLVYKGQSNFKRYIDIDRDQQTDLKSARNEAESKFSIIDGGWSEAYRDQKIEYVIRKANDTVKH